MPFLPHLLRLLPPALASDVRSYIVNFPVINFGDAKIFSGSSFGWLEAIWVGVYPSARKYYANPSRQYLFSKYQIYVGVEDIKRKGDGSEIEAVSK